MEAALVLPLVILAVLTAIWLLTVFYGQTAARSAAHRALRNSAGILSATVLRPGENGFDGLYDTVLRQGEIGSMLEEEAEQVLKFGASEDREKGRGDVAGHPDDPQFEGSYNGLSIPPSLKLRFCRDYGRWGLYRGEIRTERACWYFGVDEAQWVRNDDWLRELKTEKGEE
ncbi:TadE family protein [Bacilliculturomica massiliensis]|uniref:TadE family protein n=1 Tax=Bacilliculturomica massiliensis TaxID=1917867 RepID=UPI0013EF389F|nr:TadE family protein [Bacilliculturomica massiliensis]